MKSLFIAGALMLILALLAWWLWTPDLEPATLAQRYQRSSADVVEVAGTRLHVRDDGPRNAPAVLMLHGFGASLHTWEPWAQALQGQYRVVRFDLPGSGLSPPDATGDYSDERSRQLLAGLMDRLGLARASLVGNSMGGRIAWSFAAREPQRVDKLVLVSPDGFASEGFAYDTPPEVPGFMSLMRYALPRSALRMSLQPAYADPKSLTPELLARYHDLLRAPGAREAMLLRMRQLVLRDPLPWLRRVQAPTLLLWGEQDAMIPVANALDYQGALPQSELVRLPGLGHLPQEEDPARSLEPVRAFLQR